jgi:hypothetical protein
VQLSQLDGMHTRKVPEARCEPARRPPLEEGERVHHPLEADLAEHLRRGELRNPSRQHQMDRIGKVQRRRWVRTQRGIECTAVEAETIDVRLRLDGDGQLVVLSAANVRPRSAEFSTRRLLARARVWGPE